MTKQIFDVNNLRIASPCSVGWETMSGDGRVRRCDSCELSVYNISEMSKKEVENLIVNREGRVCLRFYRRADGTVLTKDCPVGFRAYKKRVARLAGAALAAILGLFSASYAQKEDKKFVDASKVKIVRTINQNQESVLRGVVQDSNGAVIPNAELKLYKKGEKDLLKTNSDFEGKYIFKSLAVGDYILEVQTQGFKEYKLINLKIEKNERIKIDIELQPGGAATTTIGVLAGEPSIDTTSSTVQTTITTQMIERLPR